MKLFAFLLTLAATCASAQIPNANFFNWTDDEPDGYFTSNSITKPLGMGSNVSTATGQYGNTGIRVQTVQKYYVNEFERIVPTDTIPGFVVQRGLNSKTDGFPFTDRPMAFAGSLKFEFYKPDTATIGVALYKYDNQTKNRILIGSSVYTATYYSPYGAYVKDYISFAIPFTFTSENVYPDTAVVSIYSSTSKYPEPSSVIFANNLALTGVTGIETSLMPNFVHTFPNPVSDELKITNIPSAASSIEVRDVTGRVMEVLPAKENVSIHVDRYCNGPYHYSIKTENNKVVYTNKFSVVK